MNSVEILAIGAHPDDVELNVGGSLLLAQEQNLKTAICHLTAGEMGTRGSPELRAKEAAAAGNMLGAQEVTILGLPDGKLTADEASKDKLIRVIRRLKPRILLAPYWDDLHPDHAAAGDLVKQVRFLSGLERWDTGQEPWRPEAVHYYMSHTPIQPSILVDISELMEKKQEAASCYRSQFFDENSQERETFIAGENFWEWWKARASYWGHFVGVRYAEPFYIDGPIPTRRPFDLFRGFGKYKNN